MNLSTNFTLEELTHSATAIRKGIDNTPSEEIILKLKDLCDNVLQPLRDHFGIIHVSSGYRCVELNKLIGGAKTSQHTKGEAADIKLPSGDNYLLFKYIEENLEFDQLIYEFGTDKQPQWIHVSFNEGHNRKEVLRAYKINGKTHYKHI